MRMREYQETKFMDRYVVLKVNYFAAKLVKKKMNVVYVVNKN